VRDPNLAYEARLLARGAVLRMTADVKYGAARTPAAVPNSQIIIRVALHGVARLLLIDSYDLA